jgi:hypothetical protein
MSCWCSDYVSARLTLNIVQGPPLPPLLPVRARSARIFMSHSESVRLLVLAKGGRFDTTLPPSLQGLVGPQEYLHSMQRCNNVLQRDFRWWLAAGLAVVSGVLVLLSLLLIGLLNGNAQRQALLYVFLVFWAVALMVEC